MPRMQFLGHTWITLYPLLLLDTTHVTIAPCQEYGCLGQDCTVLLVVHEI